MKIKQILVLAMAASLSSVLLQAQPGPPKPPSAEERLKHVTEKMEKDLQLSNTQKETLAAAYKAFFAEMDKLRGSEPPPPPPPPPPPANKEAADKLIKERESKIKQALTDDQFKKYQELEKQMRPGGPRKPGKDGPPPPSNS
ncbi:MAG: hypothetical protein ABIX01_20290 [Chitinophagaceae bacterium]